jgi:hypothetical protein
MVDPTSSTTRNGGKSGSLTTATTTTTTTKTASRFGSATEALLNLDPELLGYDVARLLHEGSGDVVDQLLEHLDACKHEIVRIMEASSQRKRYHHPDGGCGSRLPDETKKGRVIVQPPLSGPANVAATNMTLVACRTGTSRSNSNTTNNVPAFYGVIPTEVLRQIAQSNFLTLKEMGRFLLLVSKSFPDALGQDNVWAMICCKQWRNTSKIPRYIIEARGYQWLFHQRLTGSATGDPRRGGGARGLPNSRGTSSVGRRCLSSSSVGPKNQHHGLAAPTLSPDRLVLLTSIWKGTEEVASLAFTGDPLATLVATGELNVRLENPILLGEVPIVDGVVDFHGGRGELFDDWRATIHCVRLDEYKCCCVHETATCAWGEYDYIVDPSSQNNSLFNENGSRHHQETTSSTTRRGGDTNATLDEQGEGGEAVEVDMGYLDFSPNSDGMELTGLGRALMSRIREFDTHNERLVGIRLDATLLCFTDGFRHDASSVKLSFSELRLEVWKSYDNGSAVLFHSKGESLKHGVTLLHLFDHLLGFKA